MKLEVHAYNPNGTCCLTGKETDVLVITSEDGFLSESPISLKGLMQLAKMKLSGRKTVNRIPDAVPVNGAAE